MDSANVVVSHHEVQGWLNTRNCCSRICSHFLLVVRSIRSKQLVNIKPPFGVVFEVYITPSESYPYFLTLSGCRRESNHSGDNSLWIKLAVAVTMKLICFNTQVYKNLQLLSLQWWLIY